ncbi:MAG: peptide-N-glycosidase F-related protein [Flavipsychrobacter sp.]|nr:peptide-N-glycosidase F-related protein [Flavipsychrobacter sp.]
MKKRFHLFLAVIVCSLCSIVAKANPGDTTWVQANIAQMANTTNYDTTVFFPNSTKTYRKIYMIFTLGKYACPAGSQYCGSWDYIVNNYVMTKTGDTMEISRLITPYATTSSNFPLTWTHDYVYDVTDYAGLLKDSATIRIGYGGYSYGFTANVRFALIEGTPDRTVIGLQRLWHGIFNYGQPTDPIENHVATLSETAPANTAATEMKMRITGHGEDANDCNEFCPNTYDVIVNGSDIFTQNFWRDNCGQNPVAAQTGSWPYNRSGWCPGALVNTIDNPLGVTSGAYSVNVTFPSYTTAMSSSGNSNPSYDVEAMAVYYSGINKTLDASLEEVLAPNNQNEYTRYNNICSQPIVHVHNSGSTPITSIRFDYGVVGSYIGNYTWSGTLAPLQDTIIYLATPWQMQALSGLTSTPQQFIATITQVNGQADADASNNSITTTFVPAPLWGNQIVVKMKTSQTIDPNAVAQTWQIVDADGNVLAQRTNTTHQTMYIDTVTLGLNCYQFQMTAPDGYGLTEYWYEGLTSDAGSLTINKLGTALSLSVPNYKAGDFGSGFTQNFGGSPFKAGITNIETGKNITIDAYPNPTTGNVTVSLVGFQQVKGTLQLIDAIGRVALTQPCNDEVQTINVSRFANGVYTLVYIDNNANGKIQTRLLIAK